MIKIFSITLLACSLMLTACVDPCRPNQEPSVHLVNSSSTTYKQVYGVGKPNDLISASSTQLWKLPISLVGDKTTFVLWDGGSKRDTISFSYKRSARLESNQCGIRIYLSEVKRSTPTSLKNFSISSEFNSQSQWYEASITN